MPADGIPSIVCCSRICSPCARRGAQAAALPLGGAPLTPDAWHEKQKRSYVCAPGTVDCADVVSFSPPQPPSNTSISTRPNCRVMKSFSLRLSEVAEYLSRPFERRVIL